MNLFICKITKNFYLILKILYDQVDLNNDNDNDVDVNGNADADALEDEEVRDKRFL